MRAAQDLLRRGRQGRRRQAAARGDHHQGARGRHGRRHGAEGSARLRPFQRAAKILRLSQDLPIVVEIVDAPEKIDALIPGIKALTKTKSCLITREKVEVIRYGDGD
jgi:hypothetical protein